jgi:hypothetical protein
VSGAKYWLGVGQQEPEEHQSDSSLFIPAYIGACSQSLSKLIGW